MPMGKALILNTIPMDNMLQWWETAGGRPEAGQRQAWMKKHRREKKLF